MGGTAARQPVGAIAVAASARHLVGPNAILQTAEALLQLHGEGMRARILAGAGLPRHGADPEGLVDAGLVRRLNNAVAESFPPDAAASVMRRAGELTGDYILANRIPKAAMAVLGRLASPVSANLLLKAIARHSWTFAGNAPVQVRHGWRRAEIGIEGNPIAYGPCVWHEAVFERLLYPLAGKRLEVRETACCRKGAAACRFEIHF